MVRKDVMKFGSLFSGIGGFDVGLEAAGMTCEWQVEIDSYCRKILTKHWPDVPKMEDIRNVGKHNLSAVDLICGGFPCQPFSVAGKQRGKDDDRYLWPEMLRVINELRPTWIIAENVAGIEGVFQYDSFSDVEGTEYNSKEEAAADFKGICEREGTNTLWLVLDDLEKIGYEAQPFIIPACAVNAPHRRDRVWIVAYNSSFRCDSRESQGEGIQREELSFGEAGTEDKPIAPDTKESECESSNERRSFAGCDSWAEPWIEIASRLCTFYDEFPPGLARPARNKDRTKRLKAIGNAVVPMIPYILGKMILNVRASNLLEPATRL